MPFFAKGVKLSIAQIAWFDVSAVCGCVMVSAEKLLKAEVRVERRRLRLIRTMEEKKRLKWFHLILLASPLGLFWAWWMMAWIVFAWVTFWGVGRYMNYFHVREAEARLAKAEAEREDIQAAYKAAHSTPPLTPQANVSS